MSARLRSGVLNWALSLRFLAPIAVVIPYFTIVRSLGLYNQLPALILVYTIFNLPLSIWMLKGFLAEIPLEIEEAALVDGASRWQAFRYILLPLSRIGVLAAGIIVFAFDWAEFLFAFILTATPQAQTFPVGVAGLVTQFEIIWNEMAAAAVIAIVIPVLLDARRPAPRHDRADVRGHPREVAHGRAMLEAGTTGGCYLNGATIMTTPTARHIEIARAAGFDGVEVRAERLARRARRAQRGRRHRAAGRGLEPERDPAPARARRDARPRDGSMPNCRHGSRSVGRSRAAYLLVVPPRAPGADRGGRSPPCAKGSPRSGIAPRRSTWGRPSSSSASETARSTRRPLAGEVVAAVPGVERRPRLLSLARQRLGLARALPGGPPGDDPPQRRSGQAASRDRGRGPGAPRPRRHPAD